MWITLKSLTCCQGNGTEAATAAAQTALKYGTGTNNCVQIQHSQHKREPFQPCRLVSRATHYLEFHSECIFSIKSHRPLISASLAKCCNSTTPRGPSNNRPWSVAGARGHRRSGLIVGSHHKLQLIEQESLVICAGVRVCVSVGAHTCQRGALRLAKHRPSLAAAVSH